MLLSFIKHQRPHIDKIYLYIKKSTQIKVFLLVNGREKVGIENLTNRKTFINHSQTIEDVYENLEGYNSTKKRRVLTVFDDMIADMGSSKKLRPMVTELFLKGRKLNISLVFILNWLKL